MSNPYASPTADLRIDEPVSRSILWKIYFFIVVALAAFGLVEMALAEGAGLAEVISILLFIPFTVAFFGYVFSKRILNHRVWLIVLVLNLAWSFAYYFVTSVDHGAGLPREAYIVSVAIGVALSIPEYIAVLLYSLPSYPLWNRTNRSS